MSWRLISIPRSSNGSVAYDRFAARRESSVSAGTLGSLLDDLLGAYQQRERKFDPERLCRFEVDGQLNSCDLLHREVRRLVAPENAPGVDANLAVKIADAATIAHQAAGLDELTVRVDRRQRVADRQRRKLCRAPGREVTVADQDRTNALLRKRCESHF